MKKEINLGDLKRALEKSWSRETSYNKNGWTPENPAWGQCCVTALVVQDFFGGKIKRVDILGIGAHYYNQLPDGSEIDLTKSQFSKDDFENIIANLSKEIVDRKCVLSNRWVFKRYKTLKEKVEKFLTEPKTNKGKERKKKDTNLQPILLIILQCPWKKGKLKHWNPGIWRKEFLTSRTGKRLSNEVIPSNLFTIRIRNASPRLADTPDGIFPANIQYLKYSIHQIKPNIILACGRVAQKAISELSLNIPVINMQHPASHALSRHETQETKLSLLKFAHQKTKKGKKK